MSLLFKKYVLSITISSKYRVKLIFSRGISKQINKWNELDINIKLNHQIDFTMNFLDVHIENRDGILITDVYHKPSHDLYFLPYDSVHPKHKKKNIPSSMLIRAIRYCSTFQGYLKEREFLRLAFLLNKYPDYFIDKQFDKTWIKFGINESIHIHNYDELREKAIQFPEKRKQLIDYNQHLFVHFTFCSNMKNFPTLFHELWKKYFDQSPIADIVPILGNKNLNNLQQKLVRTKENILSS